MRSTVLRHTLAASLFGIPALLLTAPKALADKQDFWIQNNSSTDIYYLYVSESSLDTWGADILGENSILASGYHIQVIFNNPDPNVCRYDIRAEFEDGHVVEDYVIDVCVNDYYQFFDP